jgi:transcriptional regulator
MTDRTPSRDVMQGTLDMLILTTLSREPMHGFGIGRHIEDVSGGVFRVNPGSLLLAFQRLERQTLITSSWRTSANGRRAKYYRLTKAGQRRLGEEREDWLTRVNAIMRLLEA